MILIALICFLCGIVCPKHSCYAQHSAIPETLIQKLYADIQDENFRLSDADKEIIKNHLKCKLKDINTDSLLEIFLFVNHSDWCGAGSSCDYWVYQETDHGYKLLLNEKNLRAMKSFTNGYRDIVSEVPMGFCSKEEQRFATDTYKYDGQRYKFHSNESICKNVKTKSIRIEQTDQK